VTRIRGQIIPRKYFREVIHKTLLTGLLPHDRELHLSRGGGPPFREGGLCAAGNFPESKSRGFHWPASGACHQIATRSVSAGDGCRGISSGLDDAIVPVHHDHGRRQGPSFGIGDDSVAENDH